MNPKKLEDRLTTKTKKIDGGRRGLEDSHLSKSDGFLLRPKGSKPQLHTYTHTYTKMLKQKQAYQPYLAQQQEGEENTENKCRRAEKCTHWAESAKQARSIHIHISTQGKF